MNERGYKAYNPGLICRGHKYEEDTVYKKNGHGICCSGVTHYCVNPFDTLDYYPLVQPDGQFSEFTTVEAIDEPVTGDGRKFATSTIKIGFKLGFKGFIQACVDFLYEKTIKEMPKPEDVDVSDGAQIGSSGDDAKIGSSGNGAQIGSSGNGAQIGSSGDGAQIGSSGDGAQIGSSGRYAKIGSSGDDAQITVENANNVVACVGKRGRIKAPVGTWCTLAEYGEWIGEGCPCICVKSFEIDGETYKADTWYTLKDGEIVEVPEE
jgi:hypothetical protein